MRQRGVPEAPRLPCLRDLPAVPDAGDAGEVLVGEHGVVVSKQRGALPLRERGGQQRRGPVRSAVEAEADARGAGVVGVLDELPKRGGALRVVGEHLADAAREVHALPEVLQEHRAPAARIHGGEAPIGATGASGSEARVSGEAAGMGRVWLSDLGERVRGGAEVGWSPGVLTHALVFRRFSSWRGM